MHFTEYILAIEVNEKNHTDRLKTIEEREKKTKEYFVKLLELILMQKSLTLVKLVKCTITLLNQLKKFKRYNFKSKCLRHNAKKYCHY